MQYPDQLEAIRTRRLAAPIHVRIKPNNHCNHSCWYCAYRYDNLALGQGINLKDQIPEAKMFEIIDDLIEVGVRAVTFSGGGEPLIYKPIVKCIERLAAGGIKVATLTNGSNLKVKVADAFASHGTWVRVSVDGWSDDSYAEARSVRIGAFTQLLKNMEAFSKLKSPCELGVSFIATHANNDHIYEALEKFKVAGVGHVKVSGAVVANSIPENNAYHSVICDVVAEQIAKAKGLEDDHFRIVNHYHTLEGRFEKTYDYCPFLLFLTIIGADCKVYTCQDKAYTHSGTLGTIQDVRFKDFWFCEDNAERLYALNPRVSCQHHCVAHSKNLSILEFLSLDQDHGAFV